MHVTIANIADRPDELEHGEDDIYAAYDHLFDYVSHHDKENFDDEVGYIIERFGDMVEGHGTLENDGKTIYWLDIDSEKIPEYLMGNWCIFQDLLKAVNGFNEDDFVSNPAMGRALRELMAAYDSDGLYVLVGCGMCLLTEYDWLRSVYHAYKRDNFKKRRFYITSTYDGHQ